MWTKSRFANWETEGAIRERVDKALAEGAQRRLAKTASGSQDRHLLERTSASLRAGLARLTARAKPGRASTQNTMEPSPDAPSHPLHRRPAPGS